jgi:mRNA interferase HicA
MTRLPQVTARDLIRFLTRNGYVEDRQSGSHLTLWNAKRRKAVTIPVHPGDLGRGLVARILKDAGFTADDYLEGS